MLVAAGCSGAKTPSAPSGAGSTGRTLVSLALCCGNNQVALDTQRQFEAHATYTDGSVTDVTAAVTSWTSTAPLIATISNTGVVAARAAGDVQVTASYLGVQAALTLQVRPPIAPVPAPPTQGLVRIWLCCGSNQINVNWQRQLEARATYADGSTKDITGAVTSWTSSNPSIAAITTTGVLTGVAPGTTDISVTFAGFRATWDLDVVQSVFRPPALDTLTGHVREQTPLGKVDVLYADVEVIGGPSNSRVVRSESGNFFRIEGLTAAGFELAVRSRGYAPARARVAELGREIEVLLAPAPGVVSDVLQGEVCGPTRTITRTFTPSAAGFLRITDHEYQAVSRLLYGNGVLVSGDVADHDDVELSAGVKYEFRVTGDCDHNQTATVALTFLRPAE
jgi:hypothetical protein